MTNSIREKIAAGALAASIAFGPAVVPNSAEAFVHAQRGNAVALHGHAQAHGYPGGRGGGAAQQHEIPQRQNTQPRAANPNFHPQDRGIDRTHVPEQQDETHQRREQRGHREEGREEHWHGYRVLRHGWGGYWVGEWPIVVIIGEYVENSINSEAISLGPDYNNMYFMVQGQRYYGECVMRVSLYDGNDDFVANIFPEEIYVPEQSRFGNLITAAGLDRAYVQSQLAFDLCEADSYTFQ